MHYVCLSPVATTPRLRRPAETRLTACPVCGTTCWDREIPEELKEKATMKVCTECAIRRVTRTIKRCG